MNPSTLSRSQQRNLASGATPGSANYKGDTIAPSVPTTTTSTIPATSTTIPSSSSTINSSVLAPQPSITPVQSSAPTESAGLLGTIEAQAKQYANTVVKESDVNAAKAAKDASATALAAAMGDSKGQTALISEEYAAAQVDEKKKELNDINNQITAEQVSLQRKLEALDKNPEGKFGGALARDKEIATRDSARKQADLSVIALAKQNDYYGAKEVADRKVAAQLETQKKNLEALQFTYQENKESFTKSEQRQFETQQAERTRLLNKEESDLKAANALAIKALENGAPTDVVRKMQDAKNEKEALSIGGSYLNKPEYTFKTLSDGRDVMLDKSGNIVKVVSTAPLTKEQKDALAAAEQAKKAVPVLQDKVSQIDDLIKTVDAGTGAVGPNALARTSPLSVFTGAKQNFVAGVEQLVSRETLDTLVNLKQQGGTLGALSDGERTTLQSAATKIGTWKIVKDGQVVGYNTTESAFKKELETVKKLTQRAIDNALGSGLSNTDFLNTIPTTTATNADFFNSLSTPK